MEGWQKSEMGDGVESQAPGNGLMQEVMAYGVSVDGQIPSGFGVFSYYDRERNVVIWYFSPDAAFLAKKYGGAPCEKPTAQKGFSLLVGNQMSTTIHFPEHFSRR